MKKLFFTIIVLLGVIMLSGCSKEQISFKVLAPSGAPALAQASLHYNNPILDEDVSYTTDIVSGAQILTAAFANNEYQIIYAPVNVGAKMYNNTAKFSYFANVTWGNLFFATISETEFKLGDLNNKKVNFFGEGTITQTIVEHILKEKNITIDKDSKYEASSDATKGILISQPNSIVLIAEPGLTAVKEQLAKTGKTVKAISVQDLWNEVSGMGSYPQAGVFVNNDFYSQYPKIIDKYLAELKLSCDLAKSNPEMVADYATKLEYGLPAVNILAKAIAGCNIVYRSAKESRTALEYTFGLNLSLIGGKLPVDEFYAK